MGLELDPYPYEGASRSGSRRSLRKFVFAGLIAFCARPAIPGSGANRCAGSSPSGIPAHGRQSDGPRPTQVTTASLPRVRLRSGRRLRRLAWAARRHRRRHPSATPRLRAPHTRSSPAASSNQIASLLVDNEEGTSTDFANQQTALGVDRGDQARDYTVLKIDVNVPAGANCMALDYRFLSEEFPEFVGSNSTTRSSPRSIHHWKVGTGGASRAERLRRLADRHPISINGVGDTAVFARRPTGPTSTLPPV